MSRAVAVVVAVVAVAAASACTHTSDPVPAPKPAVELAPRPVPKPQPPPPPPAAPKLTALEVHGEGVLCARDAAGGKPCSKITLKQIDAYTTTPAKLDDDVVEYFTVGGKACKLIADSLTCDGEAPISNVRFRFGAYYHYLERADGVSWFQPVEAGAPELHAMAGVGTISQLAVGWRVACALATDGATWCWSDPKKPKRIATPPDVVSIVVQDPFELCVHTKSGDVHCTAPFAQTEQLACSKTSITCGTGRAESTVLRRSFDPLAMITQPLVKMALPRATVLERDDDRMYAICMDVWLLDPSGVGGCAVDPASGGVSCFASCGKKWRTYRVTGLPAMERVSPDTGGGYGIARDHAVWSWARPEPEEASGCAMHDVAATKLADAPPLVSLAETLYVRTGPTTWDRVRCGITVDGAARCWAAPRPGRPPPAGVFDPFAYSSAPTKP